MAGGVYLYTYGNEVGVDVVRGLKAFDGSQAHTSVIVCRQTLQHQSQVNVDSIPKHSIVTAAALQAMTVT